jgi:hypothetical protein
MAATTLGAQAITIPVGTTAERPTPGFGMLRYNSTTNKIEWYDTASSTWKNL